MCGCWRAQQVETQLYGEALSFQTTETDKCVALGLKDLTPFLDRLQGRKSLPWLRKGPDRIISHHNGRAASKQRSSPSTLPSQHGLVADAQHKESKAANYRVTTPGTSSQVLSIKILKTCFLSQINENQSTHFDLKNVWGRRKTWQSYLGRGTSGEQQNQLLRNIHMICSSIIV